MKPILFGENERTFTTNGFGRMADAISCKVTEERNGEYQFEMVYPVDGKHFSELTERMILYSIHDDKKDRQPFRIYEITKPMNGLVTIRARHVSYDLNKIVVSPFTAGSCIDAIAGLKTHSATTNDFDFWSDKEVVANFELKVPMTCRSILGGTEGSILDVYGTGEYEWDHWNVKLHLHRGAETDVVIRYGKNLTDLEDVRDVSGTYNAVYPYWQGSVDDGTGNSTVQTVYIDDDPTKRVLVAEVKDANNQTVTLPLEVHPLDLSSEWQEPPTQAQLRDKATSYLTSNQPWVEKQTTTVSFFALAGTEEYKSVAPLERLGLCDTVTVVHRRLGVKIKKKIIKVVYDVLSERYISMELGDTSKSFTSSLKNDISVGLAGVKKEITPRSVIESKINHASELIRGGLGGYVYLKPNANGEPEEILIMDHPDINDAINVIRMNQAGIAFSTEGYNPIKFKSAWTIDGNFVADFITTGTLTANLIKAGVLSDLNGNTSLNLDTGRLVAKNLFIDTASENGSFEIDAKNFKVTPAGNITMNDATLNNVNANGSFHVSNDDALTQSNKVAVDLSAGIMIFSFGNRESKTRFLNMSINPSRYRYDDNQLGYDGVSHRILYIEGLDYLENRKCEAIEFGFSGSRYSDGIISNSYKRDILTLNNGLNRNDRSEDIYIDGQVYVDGELHFKSVTSSVTPSVTGSSSGSVLIGWDDGAGNVNHCGLDVWGDLVVSSSSYKSRAMKTENYNTVLMNAVESTAPIFSDLGSGTIGEDGACLISFDPKFRETINLSHEYQVFLTPLTSNPVTLSCEKQPEYFIVYGDPGVSFDWIVYARQKEFPHCRMEEWIPPETKKHDPPMSQLESLADQYIKNYESEVYS